MRKAIAIAGVVSLLKAGATAGAMVAVPAVDVPAMVKAADVIVIGRGGEVNIDTSSASETLVVWVDQVIAGATAPPSRLPVRLNLPVAGSSIGSVANGQYGIFFLRQGNPGGAYQAADPYHPALVAAPPARNAARSTGSSDALTGTAQELARVLTAPPANLLGMNDPAAAEYFYWRAADAIETIPTSIAAPLLTSIADSGQSPARLWAIAALLYVGNPEQMAARIPDYLQSVEADLINPNTGQNLAIDRLAVSVQAKVTAPGAVPVLAALLGSSDVTVRRAAANVLAKIATPEVIAPLASTALNDADPRVRYYAVRGLAQATGAAVSTLPEFYAKEAEMLARWRSWAKTNATDSAGGEATPAPATGACTNAGPGTPFSIAPGQSTSFTTGFFAPFPPVNKNRPL